MKPEGRPNGPVSPEGTAARGDLIPRSRRLCHELNQPMQAISGYADLLAIGIDRDHAHYPKIERIRDAVRQVNEIVGDLAALIRSGESDAPARDSTGNSRTESPPAAAFRNPPLTVDIVIEISGGVVLIERKNPPYGWALPGGFVDYGETLESAAIREAREETSLDVVLREQFHAYSAPDRDPRQHTVTMVFLATAEGVPRAADDARNLAVFSRGNLPGELAFDHGRILADYFRYRDGASRKDIFPLP